VAVLGQSALSLGEQQLKGRCAAATAAVTTTDLNNSGIGKYEALCSWAKILLNATRGCAG
jgi:hypothetical protein